MRPMHELYMNPAAPRVGPSREQVIQWCAERESKKTGQSESDIKRQLYRILATKNIGVRAVRRSGKARNRSGWTRRERRTLSIIAPAPDGTTRYGFYSAEAERRGCTPAVYWHHTGVMCKVTAVFAVPVNPPNYNWKDTVPIGRVIRHLYTGT